MQASTTLFPSVERLMVAEPMAPEAVTWNRTTTSPESPGSCWLAR